jgi:hypothetical protein
MSSGTWKESFGAKGRVILSASAKDRRDSKKTKEWEAWTVKLYVCCAARSCGWSGEWMVKRFKVMVVSLIRG